MTRRKKAQGPLVGSVWSKQLGQDYPDLKMADRAVGLLLAHYADYQTGRGARPSQETLAEALGISDRTVRASLKRLEEAGAIYCSGRWHRVKVWDLVLSNRNGASAYDDSKAEALSNVTGRDESGNRNDASDKQSEHPDRKGGSDDDALRSAPQRVAPLALSERRLTALATLLPESWQGAPLSRSQESLAQAVAELDAAGWTHQQIRQGLSTLGPLKSVNNPSAVLAAHVQRMLKAGPADVVTVRRAQPQFWHDSKALKPHAEWLGISLKILAGICEELHAEGMEVTPLSHQKDYWIAVTDPRIPEGAEAYANINQGSVYVSSPLDWTLERDQESSLEWSTIVQRTFPAKVREMSASLYQWYAEHEPVLLVEHLQQQGLMPTEEEPFQVHPEIAERLKPYARHLRLPLMELADFLDQIHCAGMTFTLEDNSDEDATALEIGLGVPDLPEQADWFAYVSLKPETQTAYVTVNADKPPLRISEPLSKQSPALVKTLRDRVAEWHRQHSQIPTEASA